MNVFTSARVALLVISAAGLSACGKTMGPYTVELKPTQKFELHAVSGKALTFEAGQSVGATATYFGSKKRIQLNIGSETVRFSGAKLDKDLGQIVAPAEKSGQGVGIVVSRSLSCNPECEIRETRREHAACTYYVQERYTVCQPTGGNGGGVACYDEWRQVPRPGQQWVERTTITRNYDLTASITDASGIEVATASGSYSDQTEEARPLSACF